MLRTTALAAITASATRVSHGPTRRRISALNPRDCTAHERERGAQRSTRDELEEPHDPGAVGDRVGHHPGRVADGLGIGVGRGSAGTGPRERPQPGELVEGRQLPGAVQPEQSECQAQDAPDPVDHEPLDPAQEREQGRRQQPQQHPCDGRGQARQQRGGPTDHAHQGGGHPGDHRPRQRHRACDHAGHHRRGRAPRGRHQRHDLAEPFVDEGSSAGEDVHHPGTDLPHAGQVGQRDRVDETGDPSHHRSDAALHPRDGRGHRDRDDGDDIGDPTHQVGGQRGHCRLCAGRDLDRDTDQLRLPRQHHPSDPRGSLPDHADQSGSEHGHGGHHLGLPERRDRPDPTLLHAVVGVDRPSLGREPASRGSGRWARGRSRRRTRGRCGRCRSRRRTRCRSRRRTRGRRRGRTGRLRGRSGRSGRRSPPCCRRRRRRSGPGSARRDRQRGREVRRGRDRPERTVAGGLAPLPGALTVRQPRAWDREAPRRPGTLAGRFPRALRHLVGRRPGLGAGRRTSGAGPLRPPGPDHRPDHRPHHGDHRRGAHQRLDRGTHQESSSRTSRR